MWVVVVAACGHEGGHNVAKKQKTLEELKPLWSAKVQAKLDKVIAAAKAAGDGELGAPADPALALDLEWDDEKAHPNAFAVQLDELQSATELAPTPVPFDPAKEIEKAMAEGRTPDLVPRMRHPRFTFQSDGHSHVFKAKWLLGVPNANGQYPEYVLDQFVNAKYMLVVTPSEVAWPGAPSGVDFESGRVKLRATLIDIDTAKPLGGFETTATSSDKVRLSADTHDQAMQDTLDRDFIAESSVAVVKGVAARWPGAKTPLTWSSRGY
jgi:hypothetical protein